MGEVIEITEITPIPIPKPTPTPAPALAPEPIPKMKYNRELNLVFCFACTVFIHNIKAKTTRHLRQVHNIVGEGVAKKMAEDLEEDEERSEGLSESEMALRKRYREVADSEDGDENYGNIVLPKIAELPVSGGFQCGRCWTIVKSQKQFLEHLKKCKKNGRKCDRIEVQVQALYVGNKAKYFSVHSGDEECNETEWLVEKMKNVGGYGKMEWNAPTSVKEYDAFLATMRFEKQIEITGMNLETAASMCETGKSGTAWKEVGTMLSKYMRNAYKMGKRNVFIKTHMFMGARLHLLVEEETVRIYVSKMVSLMVFLKNVEERESLAEMDSKNGDTVFARCIESPRRYDR